MDIENKPHYKSVVVGLSGGVNSAVAAMLLKIQKVDIIAVAIDATSNTGFDSDKNLSCHIDSARMQQIRDFCHSLNIPLHVINATDAFSENVIERWVSQKICGAIKDQCFNCHKMNMFLLYEKMKELGAEKMVTGHFAKVIYNTTTDEVSVSSANDETYDQSQLLSTIPSEILKKLVLPLSDLSMKEVTKLADNFFINFSKRDVQFGDCFPSSEELNSFLESKVAPGLRADGDIYDLGRNHHIGLHQGAHTLDFGKDLSQEVRQSLIPSPVKIAKFSLREKVIELAGASEFVSSGFQLTDCHFQSGIDLSAPFKAYAYLSDEYYECMVYLKNMNSVYIEMETEILLPIGSLVTCYKKKGKNSKVFLTGKIKSIGRFHYIERTDDIDNEAEIDVEGVDHEKSF